VVFVRPNGGHPLTNDHYVLEFVFEKLSKLVTEGGPWSHRGDVLIMVPYDGYQRTYEIVMENIG
jgi:hypothetical protein